jgi:hypothetical protein
MLGQDLSSKAQQVITSTSFTHFTGWTRLIDLFSVAVSSQDPEIPMSYSIQQAKGKQRQVLKLDSDKHKRKHAMDDDAREAMKNIEDSICASSQGRSSHSDAVVEDGPPKKRRRGVDLKMAQGCDDPSAGRSSRSKSHTYNTSG